MHDYLILHDVYEPNKAFVVKHDKLYVTTEFSMSNMAANALLFHTYEQAKELLDKCTERGINAYIATLKFVEEEIGVSK